ncbi:MAG TPA: hypothetical protein VLX92_24610 [Kofleriaceae bacterium]|nr:hypothetical protein [Kofleriaceae bacterium]
MKRALALAVVLAACEGKAPEPDGIGPYVFGKTTAGSVHDGNCQPTELRDGRKATWCFALPPFKVGKRVADVDAYFAGTEPTAPLIEVQLKVRGCREDEVDQWMRERFGPPIESKATREYWKNSFLWAAALLPSEPGRCLIHFLPVSENAEIARIKQE